MHEPEGLSGLLVGPSNTGGNNLWAGSVGKTNEMYLRDLDDKPGPKIRC